MPGNGAEGKPAEGDPAAGAFPEGGAAALRREDGVRALSRAVERDARRYDGGFTIY